MLAVPALLVGVCLRRWWAIGLAVPAGVWAAYEIPLENSEPPHAELELVVAGLTAVFVVAGVALGRLVTRARR